MIRSLPFLLIVIVIAGCQSKSATTYSENKYFEGIIKQNIALESFDDQWTDEYLNEVLGGYAVTHFKKGSFYRKEFSNNDELMKEVFFDVSNGKTFIKEVGYDTLLWIDHLRSDVLVTFQSKKDSIILGLNCKGIHTQGTMTGPGFKNKKFEISGDYYFAPEFKINPDWFTNIKDASFNEIAKAYPYLCIYEKQKLFSWYRIQEATEITPTKIKDDFIKVPDHFEDLPKKEL